MEATPAATAAPSPRTELQQRAMELQARLGYVQMQIDALVQEKRALVAALRSGEQVYAALAEQARG